MKKKIFLILILIMITTLVSCKKETKKGCEHTFQEATCTQAKTCSKCGATEGEALGHTFQKYIYLTTIVIVVTYLALYL